MLLEIQGKVEAGKGERISNCFKILRPSSAPASKILMDSELYTQSSADWRSISSRTCFKTSSFPPLLVDLIT